MRRPSLILLFALALALPLQAEEPNLSTGTFPSHGAASRMLLSHQMFQAAMAQGDGLLLVAAVRLARSVTLREPTSWEQTRTGDAVADQPPGQGFAPDPGGPEAAAIALSFSADSPALMDLVYDLEAEGGQGPHGTATQASAELAGGQSDLWRMPLFGEVPAEIALIGDGDGPLSLTITDDSGQIVCARPPSAEPGLCRFAPARNGFFSVEVRNAGTVQNSYRLIGN
jgi:hypothetical protein